MGDVKEYSKFAVNQLRFCTQKGGEGKKSQNSVDIIYGSRVLLTQPAALSCGNRVAIGLQTSRTHAVERLMMAQAGIGGRGSEEGATKVVFSGTKVTTKKPSPTETPPPSLPRPGNIFMISSNVHSNRPSSSSRSSSPSSNSESSRSVR